jgi:hypothetical protein
MRRIILKNNEARIFIEGLYYFVKSAKQTGESHLIMAGYRFFTMHKSRTRVGYFIASYDTMINIYDASVRHKALKAFYGLLQQYTITLLSSVFIINIRRFYTCFDPIFTSSKIKKQPLAWDKALVAFSSKRQGITHAVYFRFAFRYNAKFLFKSSKGPIEVTLPRLVRFTNFQDIRHIYGAYFKYVGYLSFSQTELQKLSKFVVPLDIDLANPTNPVIVLTPTAYNLTYYQKRYRTLVMTLSKNMILKEFTKCAEVYISLFQSTIRELHCIVRISAYYEGAIFSSDLQMLLIKR